jgi:WD domain, G-beta repeat
MSPQIERSFGKGQCFSVKYSLDGRLLLASYENRGIDLISCSSESLIHIHDAHQDCVNNVCWLEPNTTFASCGDDGRIALWDVRLLNKPTQVIALDLTSNVGYAQDDVYDPLLLDSCVKDMHFLPASTSHESPQLVVSTFSEYLHVFFMNAGRLESRKKLEGSLKNNRTLVIPENVAFGGGSVIQAHSEGALLTSMGMDWSNVRRQDSVVLEPKEEIKNLIERSVQPYRSLAFDPLGGGLVVGRTRNSPYWVHGPLHSSVVYMRLLPHPKTPSLIGGIERKFFLRQRASEEILQQPAFAPNGLFLAAPQDRRVDILTSGGSALPFSEYTGSPKQFTQAAVVRLPKCGDVVCCAISPQNNFTIASGCTMGHVHFAQPYL